MIFSLFSLLLDKCFQTFQKVIIGFRKRCTDIQAVLFPVAYPLGNLEVSLKKIKKIREGKGTSSSQKVTEGVYYIEVHVWMAIRTFPPQITLMIFKMV